MQDHEKPHADMRTSVKNNSLGETPQYTDLLLHSSPLYTDSVRRGSVDVFVCSNSLKKQPWLLRNALLSRMWDRVRGFYFDWRLKMTGNKKAEQKSTVKLMSTDVRPPNDDRQLSIYELLYATQCQAISEFIEMMVRDGNMTDAQLDFVQRKLLGGLTDSAKASLVIRAMYGNRKDHFTFADKANND
jgi:hypothetical protein